MRNAQAAQANQSKGRAEPPQLERSPAWPTRVCALGLLSLLGTSCGSDQSPAASEDGISGEHSQNDFGQGSPTTVSSPGSDNRGAQTSAGASGVASEGTAPPVVVDGAGNVIIPPPLNLEAEEEVVVRFELPSAGERYVYAANPESNSISVIDSETLSIHTVEGGDRPTYLRSYGAQDAAIVLNINSSDATLVATADGRSRTETVDVVPGSNAIAVSPDGRHAVVYFNAEHRTAGPSGSFQDLSVILLDEGEAVGMTVGFRPSAIDFSDDGTRALVTTEDGVSILDFDAIRSKGSHIARTVSLGDATEAQTLDVSITPDGRYALARPQAEGVLRLADLDEADGNLKVLDLTKVFATAQAQAEARLAKEAEDARLAEEERLAAERAEAERLAAEQAMALDASVTDAGADTDAGSFADASDATNTDSGNSPAAELLTEDEPPTNAAQPSTALQFTEITDVDLAPNGEFAIAVIRDRRTVIHVPVPEAFEDESLISVFTVGEELVGSVSIAPNGSQALLYTTALSDVERITILNLDDASQRVVRLPKAVQSVTVAPDSESALLVHRKLDGDPNQAGIDPDLLIDRSYGYSLLKLDDGFSKLQLTTSPLGPSTVVPDASALFILFNSPGVQEVHRVGLDNFLVTTVKLGSVPTSLGAVPQANKVFVGQDHPDGRITFIDWTTAETESVTGFELNSRIRE